MLATGLADEDGEVVVVTTTIEAEREIRVTLSNGRVGVDAGTTNSRLGASVGKAPSDPIAYSTSV